jgi:hypothetical protein
MEPKAKIIISRYKEDYVWIENYTQNYIIYNKGEPIITDDLRIVNTENLGGNQRDIFKFIFENYENLPDCIAFIQAIPWDHVKKEIFDALIYNDYFTSLEYYGPLPANELEARSENGDFYEYNCSWYIDAHNQSHNQTCRYSSFDEFMNKYFNNYEHVEYIRFCPGSQYIIRKEQALFYPKRFWETLMNELNSITPTEGHIIERALFLIFSCIYELKEVYD